MFVTKTGQIYELFCKFGTTKRKKLYLWGGIYPSTYNHRNKMANELIFLAPDLSSELPLPYAEGGVRAGFPSPAQDYMDQTLDLNRELIKNPQATFYVRVVGDSMMPGFAPGDLLVVDRSLSPNDGDPVVCFVNGEFTLKNLNLSELKKGIIWLEPTNPAHQRIRVQKEEQFEIWGVVKFVIHNVCGN